MKENRRNRQVKEKRLRGKNGITLIALVLTIAILLILARNYYRNIK